MKTKTLEKFPLPCDPSPSKTTLAYKINELVDELNSMKCEIQLLNALIRQQQMISQNLQESPKIYREVPKW